MELLKLRSTTHKGNTLFFDPVEHSYKDQNGRKYVSVTQVTSRLFPEFEKEAVAKRLSNSSGKPAAQYIKEWEAKALQAQKYGNWCHYYAEAKLMGYPILPISRNPRQRKARININKTISSFIKGKEVVGCEKMIFSPSLYTSGTIDLLLEDDTTVYVTDWKSNEDLDLTNKFKSFGFEMFKDVPASKFGHYTAQLNIYEFILKQEGYADPDKKWERFIFHIDGDYKKPIPVPDLQSKIKKFYGA